MVNHQNLIISVSILAMIMVVDHVLIDQHPDLLNYGDSEDFISSIITEDHLPHNGPDTLSNEEIEQVLNDIDIQEVQDDMDNPDTDHYPGPNTKAFYQIPTDYKTPSFDLNEDCYKRGDGRGNNQRTQRYYTGDVL